VPDTDVIKGTLAPNSSAYTNYSVPSGWLPKNDTPAIKDSVCNSDLPNNATYDRFIWMCNYYISQGFFVNLDFHRWPPPPPTHDEATSECWCICTVCP